MPFWCAFITDHKFRPGHRRTRATLPLTVSGHSLVRPSGARQYPRSEDAGGDTPLTLPIRVTRSAAAPPSWRQKRTLCSLGRVLLLFRPSGRSFSERRSGRQTVALTDRPFWPSSVVCVGGTRLAARGPVPLSLLLKPCPWGQGFP